MAKATITPVVPVEREVVLTLTETEARQLWILLRNISSSCDVYTALDNLYL